MSFNVKESIRAYTKMLCFWGGLVSFMGLMYLFANLIKGL